MAGKAEEGCPFRVRLVSENGLDHRIRPVTFQRRLQLRPSRLKERSFVGDRFHGGEASWRPGYFARDPGAAKLAA